MGKLSVFLASVLFGGTLAWGASALAYYRRISALHCVSESPTAPLRYYGGTVFGTASQNAECPIDYDSNEPDTNVKALSVDLASFDCHLGSAGCSAQSNNGGAAACLKYYNDDAAYYACGPVAYDPWAMTEYASLNVNVSLWAQDNGYNYTYVLIVAPVSNWMVNGFYIGY